jgi:peptidoglycan/xylan/chitin deacetylase (PgdA/CDA1 family)
MSAQAEIACLLYHEITDDPRTSGFQRPSARHYAHTTARFLEHLDRLAARAFTPALVSRLDLRTSRRHLLLTFDDGGRSALYVAEELARRGWPGHFFLVTSRFGERTFLDRSDVRCLRSYGHLVGTHSHTHPNIFRDLTPAEMSTEWRVSARILEDTLGEPCLAAAVPGGDLSAQVLSSASEAGFRYLFTSEPWVTPRQVGDCWVLGRACLKSGTTPETIEALASFRGWRRAQLVRGLKDVMRRSFAPLYRAYVARSTTAAT